MVKQHSNNVTNKARKYFKAALATALIAPIASTMTFNVDGIQDFADQVNMPSYAEQVALEMFQGHVAFAAAKFKDLKTTHWAYDSIMKMNEQQVIGGFPDGTVKPEGILTEEQFAKIAFFALAKDKTLPANVPGGTWSSPVYSMMEALGSPLKGYDNLSQRLVGITRGQVAVVLAHITTGKVMNQNDAILYLYSEGLTNGVTQTGDKIKDYQPNKTLTRAESAAFMLRVMNKVGKIDFPKAGEVKVPVPVKNNFPSITLKNATANGQALIESLTKPVESFANSKGFVRNGYEYGCDYFTIKGLEDDPTNVYVNAVNNSDQYGAVVLNFSNSKYESQVFEIGQKVLKEAGVNLTVDQLKESLSNGEPLINYNFTNGGKIIQVTLSGSNQDKYIQVDINKLDSLSENTPAKQVFKGDGDPGIIKNPFE